MNKLFINILLALLALYFNIIICSHNGKNVYEWPNFANKPLGGGYKV